MLPTPPTAPISAARLLPLLLLAACFDGATTRLRVDLKEGKAQVAQQLHNAWPDEVGCTANGAPVANEVCVEGVRARLERGRQQLSDGGASVTRAGIVLTEGELDLRYDYTAPVGAPTLKDQGLSLVWIEERTPRQIAKGKPGKRQVAFLAASTEPARYEVTVDGRYRRLSSTSDGERLDLWLLRGRTATITSEWKYVPGPNDPASPGAWLKDRPGLEDALRASGLVVGPVAEPEH